MSSIRKIVQMAPEAVAAAMKPTQVKGRWIKPEISRRRARVMQKLAMRDGTYGSFEQGKGGWLPEWDTLRRMPVPKPPKGKKRERTLEARIQKVQEGLAEQPKKLEEYKKTLMANRAAKTKTSKKGWQGPE